ncbi:L-threonylcarbamoyladenylate synthase [Paenibacillus sp. GCM10027626]|uniref:L-threonylcarbamoyladenylate synthase n=1 Tax=Paenibacillus sp. GCM10027626 TaxID=3273411 RepID=UPI003642292E
MSIDTQIWHVEREQADIQSGGFTQAAAQALNEAANMLREGGTVAFPSETVYGLGADARNAEAVARIFAAKGRPSDNPLIVHIANRRQLDQLVLPYGEIEARLMERFWPGPLTLVLPVRPGALPPAVTAGLDTVAVRMPAHPIALELIARSGCPLAGPSANRSGRPSPTHAEHVRHDLQGLIDGIVDSGPSRVGVESTVVEVDQGLVRILRPGGVTAEALREIAPEVEEDAALTSSVLDGAPRSPGMKYAHYAPQGKMRIVRGEIHAVAAYINAEVKAASQRRERTGVLAFAEHAGYFAADDVIVVGSAADPQTAAAGLYAALRTFDERQTAQIWAEACSESGIGRALMNRLVKAAGHQIVDL